MTYTTEIKNCSFILNHAFCDWFSRSTTATLCHFSCDLVPHAAMIHNISFQRSADNIPPILASSSKDLYSSSSATVVPQTPVLSPMTQTKPSVPPKLTCN